MDLILADKNRKEIRLLQEADADIDIGDTNDFQFTFSVDHWMGDIQTGCYAYIPGTEFGGPVGELMSSTAENRIYICGDTWRGMLAKKIIEPPAGQDYKTVSGELNTVIASLVQDAKISNLISVPEEDTGITVSNFRFDRYCTLLAGIEKMLSGKGYRLEITYVQQNVPKIGYVSLKAVPAVDYSGTTEISQDNNLDFTVTDYKRGINHLICLGKGDLKDRLVRHLYVQQDSTIGTAPYYVGLDERTSVYDSEGAEEQELIENGIERLRELMDKKSFQANIRDDVEMDMQLGDTISGRDYITGISVKKPIIGKILTIQNGEEKMEYKIEGDD